MVNSAVEYLDYDKIYTYDEMLAILRQSTTRQEVDCFFKNFNIDTDKSKLEILDDAMYNPISFRDKDNLSLEVDIFLTRGWELNEFYIKAGL